MHQFNMLLILTCAKNQPDRLVLAFKHFVLFQPTKIEFHLTFVSRFEI